MEDTLLRQYLDAMQATEQEDQQLEREASELNFRLKYIASKRANIAKDRTALEQLIASRRRRLGLLTDEPAGTVENKFLVTGQTGFMPVGFGNKSAFLRALLTEHPGLTIREIRKAAIGHFPELPSNFPHTLLDNWLKKGRVRRKDDRFFLTEIPHEER